MASKSKVEGDERKYPSLIITVLAALAAQIRELNDQLASLSAEETRMQSAISEQLDQIKELKRSNALLRLEAAEKELAAAHLRAIYAEANLEAEKSSHKITSDALNLELMNEIERNTAGGAPLSLRTRKQEFSEDSGRPAKKSKRATIVCVECYKFKTHKQCDGSSPCWPCKYLNKDRKRMRCKHFTADTCPISNCTRAHSDSGFSDESLVNSYHVAQSTETAPTIPPKPTTD